MAVVFLRESSVDAVVDVDVVTVLNFEVGFCSSEAIYLTKAGSD